MSLTRGQILRNPEIIGNSTVGGGLVIWDGDETNSVTIKAPDSITANFTLTLPADDGGVDQYLKTDGSGNLTWSTITVSAGGSSGNLQYNNAGTISGATGLSTDGTHLTVNTQGEVRFADSTGGEYVAFRAPATVTANRQYTLPDAIGSVGQVLKIAAGSTSTVATLIWSDDLTGETGLTIGGSDTHVQYNNGGLLGGEADFTYNNTTNVVFTTGGYNTGAAGSYSVNGTSVLNATTLGSGVTTSSLTSVGTLVSLQVDDVNVNGNVISTTTTNTNIVLTPNGTGVTQSSKNFEILAQSDLVLRDTDNSNFVALQAPASVTSNYTLTFPAAIGAADEILAFDGSGNASFVSNLRTLNFIIDAGGIAIEPGVQGYAMVDFDCQVTGWTIMGDGQATGAIVVDVWKTTYANFNPPTTPSATQSIAGTEKPTITSGAQKGQDLSLTTWANTTIGGVSVLGGIAAGEILGFNVDSVANFRRVTVSLRLRVL